MNLENRWRLSSIALTHWTYRQWMHFLCFLQLAAAPSKEYGTVVRHLPFANHCSKPFDKFSLFRHIVYAICLYPHVCTSTTHMRGHLLVYTRMRIVNVLLACIQEYSRSHANGLFYMYIELSQTTTKKKPCRWYNDQLQFVYNHCMHTPMEREKQVRERERATNKQTQCAKDNNIISKWR